MAEQEDARQKKLLKKNEIESISSMNHTEVYGYHNIEELAELQLLIIYTQPSIVNKDLPSNPS